MLFSVCTWDKFYPSQNWVGGVLATKIILQKLAHKQSLFINRWLMHAQQCLGQIRLGVLYFSHLPSSPPSTVYWYWISCIHLKELLKDNNINRMLSQCWFKLQMPLLIINKGSTSKSTTCSEAGHYCSSVSHLLPQIGAKSHCHKWNHQFCCLTQTAVQRGVYWFKQTENLDLNISAVGQIQ